MICWLIFLSLLNFDNPLIKSLGAERVENSLLIRASIPLDSILVDPEIESDADSLRRRAAHADDPKKAIEIIDQALVLGSINQSDLWLADARTERAGYYFKLERIEDAFVDLQSAETVYSLSGEIQSQIAILETIGRFFEERSAPNYAEQYFKRALTSSKDPENPKFQERKQAIANLSLKLADILLLQDDVQNAEKYCLDAVDAYKGAGDRAGLAIAYIRLASILRRLKQFARAERLLIKQVLPLLRSAGYEGGRTRCFDELGKIYYAQKRYSEAKWFFIQANTQARELHDISGIILSLVQLGKVKIDIHDIQLAQRDFNEAQNLASNSNNLSLASYVNEGLAYLYKRIGNENAYQTAISRSIDQKNVNREKKKRQVNEALLARIEPVRPWKKIDTVPEQVDKNNRITSPIKIFFAILGILLIILLILKRRNLDKLPLTKKMNSAKRS